MEHKRSIFWVFLEHRSLVSPFSSQSIEELLDLHFEWVLPGHGRRGQLPANRMREELVNCIEWMSTVP